MKIKEGRDYLNEPCPLYNINKKTMTIDLIEKGEAILRYDSDIIPRVGETISTFGPRKEYTVITVDHLLGNKLVIGEKWAMDLVTIEVVTNF